MLSNEEFISIFSKVPRLCVDLIIMSDDGVLLSQRSIEPYLGEWHLPGGTVYKGETIEEAAHRIAEKETGLKIKIEQCLGYMEFLDELRGDAKMHSVSIAIKAISVGGTLRHDEDAKDINYFKDLPEKTIKQHYDFLKNHKLVN